MSRPLDLARVYRFAQDLGYQAGCLIAQGQAKRFSQLGDGDGGGASAVEEKKNSVDLVTEVDKSVEEYVKKSIHEEFEGIEMAFIGEESFAAGEKASLGDQPTFIVDPIDGTTNFVHGLAQCCISIGFTLAKVPTIGVVYCPFTGQLYHARRGHGAFLVQIYPPGLGPVGGTHELEQALQHATRLPLSAPHAPPSLSLGGAQVAVEWGSDRSEETMRKKCNTFARLCGEPHSRFPFVKDGEDDGASVGGAMVHSLRSFGSAAINYCAVASGTMDMYWEIGCWEWDVMGGSVIALEAGARLYASKAWTKAHPEGLGREHDEREKASWEEWALGKKYLVVRACPTKEEQIQVVRDFYARVEEWESPR